MKTLTAVTPQNKVFTRFSQWHYAYATRIKPFKAIKWDGVLRPCAMEDKSVFVYGLGHKSVGKKAIEIPVIDNDTDLQLYYEKYGADCMFYALTTQHYRYQDCCWTDQNCEFSAMIYLGIDKWLPYVERVRSLIDTVNSIYMDKYGIIADNEILQTTKAGNIVFRDNLFTVSVCHYLAPFVRILPHFDIVADDTRLVSTYVNCELSGKWDQLEADTTLPESVKDRLVYLFNEDVAREYETLMHYFGLV